MMRIRRKFALIICGIVIVVFLCVYLIINHAVPNDKKTYLYLQNKLEELEKGLNHHREVVGEIKKQINTLQDTSSNDINNNNNNNNAEPLQQPKPQLDNREMFKESVIKSNDLPFQKGIQELKCSLKPDVVPKTNIQMLEIYRNVSFDNVDGGEWKQGWRITYDAHQWNSHHKLKVFVVPHSHNDPGWIQTFDDYYNRSTKNILNNMLRHLDQFENMKFIWAEISYFQLWYDHLSPNDKTKVKKILKRKQLEFVTGGWVMTDEANSHWLSILQQLTEGQKWLKLNLNYTPKSSWAIDPFGYSATMPVILKGANFENMLIQRTHYIVKKRLAQTQELEFRWRQLWDTTGETDLLTHMMPFYSYDVPHTCGPDPKVCCQFDFKRLPGYGLTCPWQVPPQQITEKNVAAKAELILDQWRKKSVLYKTKSVLIPLGDDFRYSQSVEWEAQRENFEKIFEYINNNPDLNTEAKFGTLSEYFDSVRSERDISEFPTLSGDFFTYADRDTHYWSGYYTSRPFHKRMDRVLLNYLRTAEMLHAWVAWDDEAEFDDLLEVSRRELSLFQHHDGITGTAKDEVVIDYALRMVKALNNAKTVIQQSVYRLLTKPSIYKPDYKFQYFNIDDSRSPSPEDSRPVIILGDEMPNKHIVVHNSLPYEREEIVEFYVSRPFVKVTDFDGNLVECQVAPIWSWHSNSNLYKSVLPQASTTKYRVIFKARAPPLGMTVYTITATTGVRDSDGTKFSKITILTSTPFSINAGDYPHSIDFVEHRDISLTENHEVGASFNNFGLLKSILPDKNSENFPIHLEFLKYGVKKHQGEQSGAYLFLPDGDATTLKIGTPVVLVSKGELESSVSTGLPFVLHETIIRDNSGIEIRNLVDIGDMGDTEIIMRVSTNINSKDTFFTDLNGLQIIKRERFGKLPLQANYYPIPTSIYIEDESIRLTLLTAQPLGGSSMKSGQLEIMQDRRLLHDDNRGLGQGVLDNQPTLQIFKLILENRESCTKFESSYPAGYLTLNSHHELQTLLHPFEKLVYHENDWVGAISQFGINHEPFERGIEIAAVRELSHVKTKDKSSIGVVVHRKHFAECSNDINRDGIFNIKRLFALSDNKELYSAPLTLLKKNEQLTSDEITICPMDIKAFIIEK